MKRKYLKGFKKTILRNTKWMNSTIINGEEVRIGTAGEYTIELRAAYLIIRGLNDYYKFIN